MANSFLVFTVCLEIIQLPVVQVRVTYDILHLLAVRDEMSACKVPTYY